MWRPLEPSDHARNVLVRGLFFPFGRRAAPTSQAGQVARGGEPGPFLELYGPSGSSGMGGAVQRQHH